MNIPKLTFLLFLLQTAVGFVPVSGQPAPDQINFTRQAARRFIFDNSHVIPLAALKPEAIIGMVAMHPIKHYRSVPAQVHASRQGLTVQSGRETETAVWFGGFNPFALYTVDVDSLEGQGEIGFQFSDAANAERYIVTVGYQAHSITDVRQKLIRGGEVVVDSSIAVEHETKPALAGKLRLQMLGSGLTLYIQNAGLPLPIGQSDFSHHIDLRKKSYLHTFQSSFYVRLQRGAALIGEVTSVFSSGMGLADIRAITYEDGTPLLDQGRLWYTMTIRGRALPHHVQGVFSMDPTVFDLRFEGVVLFERQDGILRNEVASHIFFDRNDSVWRGITTGFSAYATVGERKQLLAVESEKDPRFGFSIMRAAPFGLVGDIEDPHIIYDAEAKKWRMLTCENSDGYKAIMLESDTWNNGYRRIAGPVNHNSTGTSIQRIGGKRYCFSGSQERKIFIYTYPDLEEAGTLQMDLPPWDDTSGTRVWPNVIELPEGYPVRYVALMMDRFNYPGLKGPNWTYGALYLYHGHER